MGLFNFLFGKKTNITKEWREDTGRSLEFDLNSYTFCDCKIGVGNISYLSFLGPTKYVQAVKFKDSYDIVKKDYSFFFPEKGIYIECDENYTVLSIELWFDNSSHNPYTPYTRIFKSSIPPGCFNGKIIYKNKSYTFSENTTKEEIKRIFQNQEPFEDDDELLSYQNGDVITDFFFTDKGKLSSMESAFDSD